jgi:hypothetical protein
MFASRKIWSIFFHAAGRNDGCRVTLRNPVTHFHVRQFLNPHRVTCFNRIRGRQHLSSPLFPVDGLLCLTETCSSENYRRQKQFAYLDHLLFPQPSSHRCD